VNQTYETTFILEPGLDEARVQEEVDRVSQWIRDLGGEIQDTQRWGKRRLAYEIRKKRDGIYTHLIWAGSGPAVKDLERRMRLDESVMRVLTVLHVPPDLTQPQGEEAAAAAAAADDGGDE
jgi:small subunit ribosomal protein S6